VETNLLKLQLIKHRSATQSKQRVRNITTLLVENLTKSLQGCTAGVLQRTIDQNLPDNIYVIRQPFLTTYKQSLQLQHHSVT
jgi:hypothetical protein